jgi:5-methylcytosine-specific restriction endonuclease McrA
MKKPITPRSIIKHALRALWLRSRERLAALKRDQYTCQGCHRKQSKAKGREFSVEVHHVDGIEDWRAIEDYIYRHLLCDPERLVTLCKECHDQEEAEAK